MGADTKEENKQKVTQTIQNIVQNKFVTNIDVQNITNVVNQSVTKTLFTDSSSCDQAYSNINAVEIGDVNLGPNCNFNVQQEIQQNIKMLCYQVSELNIDKINQINAQMQSAIQQSLQNVSSNQIQSLLQSMQGMDSVKQSFPNLDIGSMLGKLTGAKQSGLSEQEINNTIQNQITNDISNNISNKITNNITNSMTSETTIQNVKKCMQNSVNNNVLKVGGISIAKCTGNNGVDIKQGIQSYVISQCIQTTKAVEQVFNDLKLSIKSSSESAVANTAETQTSSESTAQQQSTQTTDISNLSKNLFGSTVAMTVFFLICCVIIICCSIIASAVMYYMTKSK